MSTPEIHSNLLTVEEVAAVLRVPRARAYELARTGVIPGVVRIGRQVRVDSGRLEGFIRKGGRALRPLDSTRS
jgi:excisionase family DNA binding protein